MFELLITQKKPSVITGNLIEEEQIYRSKDIEVLFDMVNLTIKLSPYEISYTIRELEEGQVEDYEE